MTFDEQLKRTFDTLAERVHDEIARQVQSVIDELAASAQADRDQAVTDARDQAAAAREQAVAEAREQAVAEAREQAAAEAREQAAVQAAAAVATEPLAPEPSKPEGVTSASDNTNRLLDAVREIDAAHTLSQILDTLLICASREMNRVAVLLVQSGRYRGWRSIGFEPPFDRGGSVELPEGAAVMPMAIDGQVVAVLYVEHEGSEPEGAAAGPRQVLEILVRHAARCLESVTAFKAARAALAPRARDRHTATSDDAHADDDAAARRYARLLVSEIKLYHESDVTAGRRERDLATRLGGEIARARGLYEERVPAQIRRRADYFHDELVRTLANGDSTLLELRT